MCHVDRLSIGRMNLNKKFLTQDACCSAEIAQKAICTMEQKRALYKSTPIKIKNYGKKVGDNLCEKQSDMSLRIGA